MSPWIVAILIDRSESTNLLPIDIPTSAAGSKGTCEHKALSRSEDQQPLRSEPPVQTKGVRDWFRLSSRRCGRKRLNHMILGKRPVCRAARFAAPGWGRACGLRATWRVLPWRALTGSPGRGHRRSPQRVRGDRVEAAISRMETGARHPVELSPGRTILVGSNGWTTPTALPTVARGALEICLIRR
jgi:hypothetical protein